MAMDGTTPNEAQACQSPQGMSRASYNRTVGKQGLCDGEKFGRRVWKGLLEWQGIIMEAD